MSVNKEVEAIFKISKVSTNPRGNEFKKTFFSTERYIIDYAEGFTAEGWEQFDTDQDAPYFGFWINKKTFQTLEYCEGDWTLCTCPDREHFISEMENTIECYKPGYEFKTLGPEGMTIYRQDRKEFLKV